MLYECFLGLAILSLILLDLLGFLTFYDCFILLYFIYAVLQGLAESSIGMTT